MSAVPEGPEKATVEPIALVVEGTEVSAVHARPQGEPLGGIVLVPDIGGLRPLMADIARCLATHGFAVVAVEVFSRIIAAAGGPLDVDARRARGAELHDDAVLEDLAEAADHLAATDGVTGLAVLGFCLGGSYALKAAATGRFERAVAFYGMVRTPQMWTG